MEVSEAGEPEPACGCFGGKPHLKEEAVSRPQATVRRVGRRPTAIPKSEIRIGWAVGQLLADLLFDVRNALDKPLADPLAKEYCFLDLFRLISFGGLDL